MDVAYCNAEFMPLADVRVSPLDSGFLFGDGVYEMVPGEPAAMWYRVNELLQGLKRSLTAA